MLLMNTSLEGVLDKISAWSKNNRKLIWGIAVFAIATTIFIIFQNNNQANYTHYQVSKTDVIDAVELTGSVSAVDRADLSFESSGQITEVLVDEGDMVNRGDILARLDAGSLLGEYNRALGSIASAQANVTASIATLEQAEANLDSVRASNSGSITTIKAARDNLEKVTNEQDQLVTNARRALLTSDLEGYPIDASRNLPELPVTGNYLLDTEGSIILDFYRSGAGSGYSARFSGLDSGVITFSAYGLPVALGDTGLYVSLPETNLNYTFTDFEITIPNTRSSTYQTLVNNLDQARESRDRAIAAAENELNRLQSQESNGASLTSAAERQALAGITSAQAGVAAARASLTQANAAAQVIQAQLSDRILRAPFSGMIAREDLQVGETITTGQKAMTLVSDGDFEIELQVPEIDVARLETGMSAEITLDAYNDSVTWQGEVTSIEQIDTLVEGVPVYITTVTVTNPDDRIKIGMNARASIELDRVNSVVAIPRSYLNDDEGRNYVLQTFSDNSTPVETTVSIGLIGADSLVQIVSGLQAGDFIVKELDETN